MDLETSPLAAHPGRRTEHSGKPEERTPGEQAWQQTADILRRGIVGLSVAANGLDDALDGQLSALRRAIHEQADDRAIGELVEEVARTVTQLDEQRRLLEPVPGLPGLLDVLRTDAHPPLDREAAALAGQLPTKPSAEQWRAALELLRRALRRPARGGWWTRLRGGADAHERALPEAVRHTLLRLLDRLLIPSELDERLADLQARASEPVIVGELPALLDEIATLALDASRAFCSDLEAYLQRLLDRLTDIHGFLQHSGDDRWRAAAAIEALDDTVRTHVDDIRVSLDEARDLQQLKQAISERLDAVTCELAEYRRKQQTAEQATLSRVGDLSKRLRTTEQEAEQLRVSLIQQQARAQRDPLTGVANRQAYAQRLDHEYARWQRYGTPLSLVVADIDLFKQVNDRFGHSTGDKVLHTIAQKLQANLRETDFLARYGGEEFVLLMPETDLQQARHVADKLRLTMASCTFQVGSEPLPITLSFGVTEFVAGDHRETAFDRADGALYRAKNGGRNQVVVAD